MEKIINKIAIQDTYGDRFQNCWGCGPKNHDGLKLKSYPSEDGSMCVCEYIPDKHFTGGVPNNLFGGMIAMIFDCHGAASAAFFNHNNKGLEFTENTVINRYITGRLEVDYKSPVPINEVVKVTAKLEELTDKKAIILMEMEVVGKICARSKMIAVPAKENM